MKTKLFLAKQDLGLTTCGTDLGPQKIYDNLKNENIKSCYEIKKPTCKKSLDINDLAKNLNEVNSFNKDLCNKITDNCSDEDFILTIGGDHSIAIGSALASQKINKDLGIIWFDAHLDYNTFETTITGNLHGLPLAAINGLCDNLTLFYNGEYVDPKNVVIVGYRAKEENANDEVNNVINAGATIIDAEFIKNNGIEKAMNKTFEILKDKQIHFSFDLDVIDEEYAPGISTPELDGITLEESLKALDIICDNIEKIVSFDLVEFNPKKDKNNKTLNIALKIINKIINKKATL